MHYSMKIEARFNAFETFLKILLQNQTYSKSSTIILCRRVNTKLSSKETIKINE